MAFYLDTSAALKLVVVETGSAAMVRWAGSYDGEIVSSDLMRTELLRATRRVAPTEMTRARAVLDAITLLTIAASTLERAATLDPEETRSLDAIHLAAALELGDDLDGIVTYDERLAAAARGLGISVLAPT
jgi:predicted nucleic acid-binding protein